MTHYLRMCDDTGVLTDIGRSAGGRIHWTPADAPPKHTLVKRTSGVLVLKVAGQGMSTRRNITAASYTPAEYEVYRTVNQQPDPDSGATIYEVEIIVRFPVRS